MFREQHTPTDRLAVAWADRATRAPNAHVHIYVIAALAHELAGQRDLAAHCIAHVLRSSRDYRQADFFRAFQFSDGETLATAQAALGRLGI